MGGEYNGRFHWDAADGRARTANSLDKLPARIRGRYNGKSPTLARTKSATMGQAKLSETDAHSLQIPDVRKADLPELNAPDVHL